MTKKPVSPEVRAYFQELGKKRGEQLKAKYGADYFKRISAMRKTHGNQGRGMRKNSAVELAARYGVTRQRIYQIVRLNGDDFKQSDYASIAEWREAVVVDFFTKKAEEVQALITNAETAEKPLDK